MKKLYFLLIQWLVLLLLSCSENITTDISSLETWSHVKFESISHFNSITDKISSFSDQDLDVWEKDNSFQSYRNVFKQASKEWESLSSAEEQIVFLKRYEDILFFKDSMLHPVIRIPLYQSIANREGLYETNGYLNKVVGDYIVSVKSADYLKLKKINSNNLEHGKLSQDNDVKIIRFATKTFDNEARVNNTCSASMNAEYYYNMSGCRDDRKVFISINSYLAISNTYEGDWRQPRVSVQVTASYRNGWCNWNGQYDVPLSYRNVSFSIMAWVTQNGVAVPSLQSRVLDDTYQTPHFRLFWDQPIGNAVLNQSIVANPFTSLHAEASSRGVNNNWAIIDCN